MPVYFPFTVVRREILVFVARRSTLQNTSVHGGGGRESEGGGGRESEGGGRERFFLCWQLSAHMRTKHHNMQKLDLYHGICPLCSKQFSNN
jgi:hypothetical protein